MLPKNEMRATVVKTNLELGNAEAKTETGRALDRKAHGIGRDAMDDSAREELTRVAHEWDRAMVENDAEAIGRYMADDWTIIGSEGSVGDKTTFLDLVSSGSLSHDVMTSDDLKVRIYGDTAVVTARGVSGGKYQGRPFREEERSSCVFVKQEGRWKCVLTHLSRLAQKESR